MMRSQLYTSKFQVQRAITLGKLNEPGRLKHIHTRILQYTNFYLNKKNNIGRIMMTM